MSEHLHSYSSIFSVDHRAVRELLKGEVIIEEKVDGSQFSFGVFGDERELQIRSKKSVIIPDAPPGLFAAATKYVQSIQGDLKTNWTYRGEVLAKPKHNVLAYERVPNNNVIIWDIDTGGQIYLQPAEKAEEAARLGLECVPVLGVGQINNVAVFRNYLDRTSILGGQRIEGVVIKPKSLNLFGEDKKLLIAKLVSEDFKEVHRAEWKMEHGEKSGRDILGILAAQFATPARWSKAVIHLKEQGLIEGTPRDIGKLVQEVCPDVEKECKAEIMEQLYQWAWPQLRRSLVRGLPEWYKEQLLKDSFEEKVNDEQTGNADSNT